MTPPWMKTPCRPAGFFLRFYNASDVAMPLEHALQARAAVELAADALLLPGEALGLDEHLRGDARRDHDHAVDVGENEVSRLHFHALRGRARHVDGHLPRGHF